MTAKNRIKFTEQAIKALPLCEVGQKLYYDTEMPGLALCIGTKTKIFLAMRSINNQTVRSRIGKFEVFKIEDARTKARQLLALMSKGINPNDQKKISKIKNITLEKGFDDYLDARMHLSLITKKGYNTCKKLYLADWMSKPISDITKAMVSEKHASLGKDHGHAAANLTMRLLRAIFNFTIAKYDEGEEAIANPVEILSRTNAWFKIPKRRSIIKNHDFSSWYKAVLQLENETIRDYLLFTVFTGLRKTEGLTLKWGCIDFKGKTFTIKDTKNGLTHTLPLSDYLFSLLERRQHAAINEWVFHGEGKAGHLVEPQKGINEVEKKSEVQFILHDLRRTFITSAERVDIRFTALKNLLNHSSSSITEDYIITDPERLREPMQKVTDYLLALVKGDDNAEDAVGKEVSAQEELPCEVLDQLLARENPIRVLRTYRQFTQVKLAELAGVTSNYIYMLEKGDKRNATVRVLKAIAGALGVDWTMLKTT